MADPKKLEFTALGGLILQAVAVLVCVLLASKSGSQTVEAQAWYMGVGLLVWLVVLVHGRQRRLARREREEMEQLRRGRLSEEIFEEMELDHARASAGLLFFERYLVPFFSVVLSAALCYFAYRLGYAAYVGKRAAIQMPSGVAVGMVGIGFFGLLMGKYAAGLAQHPDFRLLRAAAGYLLGNVAVCILIAIAMALYYFRVTWPERIVAFVIPAVMALVGVEVLLNLVLDIYRPRVPGVERRPPYDSRLLGLFAEPEGVLKTVAATLDYQFGFKVSETWFYHFMERAIMPLILVQMVTLWLLSSIVVVQQDEIVFIERLGKPVVRSADRSKGLHASVYEAGVYLKAPWPIAKARHVPVYRIENLSVGKVMERASKASEMKVSLDPDCILWSELHVDPAIGQEASFLVPSTAGEEALGGHGEEAAGAREVAVPATAVRKPPVNLARINAFVHYRVQRKPDGTIDEQAAFNYYYRESDIRQHLEKLAYRAVCRVAASEDFVRWLSVRRQPVAEQFANALRAAVAQAGLGLEVVEAGITAVHPPAETASAYHAVVSALERRETLTHEGEKEAAVMLAKAAGESVKIRNDARGYAERVQASAEADRNLFLARVAAYELAPRIFTSRTYFDVLESSLEKQKVFIVPVTPSEVVIIDVKQRRPPELIDLSKE